MRYSRSYANDIKLLKNLEDSLGVRVTTREGWVKMEGEPEKLDRAQRVFDQLEEARKRGVDIQKHEFNYALNSVSEERARQFIGCHFRQDRDFVAQGTGHSAHGSARKIMSKRLRNTMSSSPLGQPEPAKLISPWRWRWQR